MAETYTRTEWKKGDVLTAEKLNNLENAVAIAAQALGISSNQDSSSENLQLNCASAKIGPVDISSNITIGGSNSTTITTLYGTLKTNAIESINNDDSVTINNLIVGTAETVNNATVYTGTARFDIDEVEFKKDIKLNGKIKVTGSELSIFPAAEITNLTVGSLVSNSGILTLQSLKIDQSSITPLHADILRVGHGDIDTISGFVTKYNGEAFFDTAKTTLHGQTVIDSTVDTDLTTLLTVGHTSGSGTNIRYYGIATFNTSRTEFHDIVSNGNISINIDNEDGRIIARNAYFGWQDTNVDNKTPYYGKAEFKTKENKFYNGLEAHNILNFGDDPYTDELTGEPYNGGTATFKGETTIYNLKVINDMTIGDSTKPVTVTMYNNLNVGHSIVAQDINTQEILDESYYGTATFNTKNSIFHGTTSIDNLILENVNFPEYPTTEGNYILKLNVAANGTKTLIWVSEANN